MYSRCKTELRDLLELVLIPGLAAALPWALCFRVFKKVARWGWIYREGTEEALREAKKRGWGGENEQHWLWVRKIVTLVDHADHYLGLFRTDMWMRKHMRVKGQWPRPGTPLLLATFHWGAGYWGLRHAAAHGLRPHAMVASLKAPVFSNRTVLTHYARARNKNVQKTLGANLIDAKLQLRVLLKAVRDGEALLGVLDVPADDAGSQFNTSLLGMRAVFAKGLLRLAVEHRLETVIYVTGLDVATGERFLTIETAVVPENTEVFGQHVFDYLEKLILSDAPGWHFWSISPRIFRFDNPE